MNTWNPQANELFLRAIELSSPEDRRRFLDGACDGDPALRAEVDGLLAAGEQAGSFLEVPANAAYLAATVQRPIAEQPGTMIGHYKLLEQIGEGGFGVVFMAEQQEPVRRKVALKVLKPGMDTRQVVARFEAERQALALMDHPNIAHVFDGGTTATGRPYFVMELVRGVPITEFCDQNGLAIRQRLELFVDVCQAVQHAHQKGIIHRDIKPTNVMVTLHDDTAVVKVIDFGIAKAMGRQLTDKTLFTNFAQMVGTPLYMSPEQAGMSGSDIDTRGDIYSLGVLLYELLTGTTPFENERLRNMGHDQLRRVIREEEPPKPSTRLRTIAQPPMSAVGQRQDDIRKLNRLLRRELDWIVMKALEKDRNRRYETANAMALDIERYLNDEQVLACPPSASYRVQKFARRNKRWLVTATVLALVLLVAIWVTGASATLVAVVVVAILTAALLLLVEANRRIERQRQRAEENMVRAQQAEQAAQKAATTAEAINHFLIDDLLAEAVPEKNAYGNRVTVEELLNRAARKIEGAFAGEPQVEVALRLTIGRAYRGLGRCDLAEPHLCRAVELSRAHFGMAMLEALNDLAVVLEMCGKLAEAEPIFREALNGSTKALGQDHPLTLLALHNLAWSLHDRGQGAEAESLYRQCLETRRRVLGTNHPETLTSLHHLAWLLWDQDKPAVAEPMLRETLNLRRQVLSSGHLDLSNTLTLLGWVLTDRGEAREAEPLLQEAITIRRKALPADHWLTAIAANILGACLTAQEKYVDAEPLLLESCAILQGAPGFPAGRMPEVFGRLVQLYEACGRKDEADEWRAKQRAANRFIERPGRACRAPRAEVRHDLGAAPA